MTRDEALPKNGKILTVNIEVRDREQFDIFYKSLYGDSLIGECKVMSINFEKYEPNSVQKLNAIRYILEN